MRQRASDIKSWNKKQTHMCSPRFVVFYYKCQKKRILRLCPNKGFDFGQVYVIRWLSYCQVGEKNKCRALYCANISVIDTLIHVGRIKMLHKHTHLRNPLCAHSMWSLDNGHWNWTVFDLEAQKYLYLLRSSDSQYGDKIWWQNSCHHWFREWLVISLVPAIAWTTNDDVLSIGTLDINLC